MKTILNEKDKLNIIERINKLLPERKKLWGKMNVNEMLCHTSDQIRMATGKIQPKYLGNVLFKTIVKWLILAGIPTPKGKVQTVRELNQEKEGTRPVGFDQDLKLLINYIEEFDKSFPLNTKITHPAFGPMMKKEWGRLIYLHLDHHLKQFGV